MCAELIRPLHRQRDALADADAHRRQRALGAASFISIAAVSASRAPDMPSGWPMAIAPPFGLTCSASSGRPSARMQASACAAKASLSSITSKSLDLQAEPLHQLLRRRHRAVAHDARRDARGGEARRCGPAASGRSGRPPSPEATISAAAPSLTPEALPAVTVPPLRNGVGSAASLSSDCLARMLVALDDRDVAFAVLDLDGRDLSREAAVLLRGGGALWLRNANASWSAREIWNSSATFSAVSGMESMPYCAFIGGLTKRQPIVVS